LGYYKTLKKLTGFTEFVALDGNGLRRDLIDYAKEQGGSISSDDARLLIDRFGVNQLALRHEIDKLISYAAHINRTSIELLTERTPQSSIFELLDAAFVGDTNKAMMLYHEQRSLKVEPQQIIAMLVWQLYILALIKTGGGRSVDEIALQAKISPFTVRKSFGLAHNLSLLRLKQHIADLREFDVRLKSEGILADEVVQYYLLRLGE
jgi:DNA polymerase III delta subunit